MIRLSGLALALLALAWPLPWAPTWTYPLAALGAAAAVIRWHHGPALAAAAPRAASG